MGRPGYEVRYKHNVHSINKYKVSMWRLLTVSQILSTCHHYRQGHQDFRVYTEMQGKTWGYEAGSRGFSFLCTGDQILCTLELEITVGHRTFSVHIAQMSEHSIICADLMSIHI